LINSRLQGGTYAGNAVACAAAVAVADAFKEERILENVNARYVYGIISELYVPANAILPTRSKELVSSLEALRQNPELSPFIVDVRGQGLMIAVEFASPSYSAHDPILTKNAPANLSSRVAKRCVEKGMLLLTTSAYETVRFIPPLNISKDELAQGTKIFAEAVEEVIHEG